MKDTRILVPLLEGEYNPLWKIQSRAQILFLDAVSKVAPAPLYSLRDQVLPKYRAAFAAEGQRRSNVEIGKLAIGAVVDLLYTRTLTSVKVPPEIQKMIAEHPLVYDAAAVLIDWSQKFNLIGKPCGPEFADLAAGSEQTFQQGYWPILAAFSTICFWQFHPVGWRWERPDPPRWCPPVLTLRDTTPALEVLLPIQLRASVLDAESNGSLREVDAPGWHIESETELQFRERMGDAFKHWIDNYIAARVESALAAGMEKAPGKRNLQLQFSWLARYQIDIASPEEIAHEYKVKKASVEDGIDAASRLINLQKRPAERGGLKGTRHGKPKRP